MPTSLWPSRVPPNQAATSPVLASTIVDAWLDGNGAVSKMKPAETIGDGFCTCTGISMAAAIAPRATRVVV